jgi:hypothetical protein
VDICQPACDLALKRVRSLGLLRKVMTAPAHCLGSRYAFALVFSDIPKNRRYPKFRL